MTNGLSETTARAVRQRDLARQVDTAAGGRVLLDFLDWLESPAPNGKATERLSYQDVREFANQYWDARGRGKLGA